MKLLKMIKKKSEYFTTLAPMYIVLNHHLKYFNKIVPGLSINEISKKYDKLETNYSNKEFYQSYVTRQTGTNKFFIEKKEKYLINHTLLKNLSKSDLEECRDHISSVWKKEKEKRIEIKNNLKFANIDNEMEILNEMLDKKSKMVEKFSNYGQVFEIVSFAILKVYFSILGFSLKRFSVTFSNDGGMDYLSGNGIYQVTTAVNSKKLEQDVKKSRDTERVLVLSEDREKINEEFSEKKLVTDIITVSDIKDHYLSYFKKSYRKKYLKKILETIRYEFEREYDQKSTSI